MIVLLVFTLIFGLALAAVATFYSFAIGMSDSPGYGRPKLGCGLAILGIAIFAWSVITIIARLF